MRAGGGFPRKSSSLERRLEQVLKTLDIDYIPQFEIGRCHVDFYLPYFDLAIEVDGSFWHSRPLAKRRDMNRDRFIRSRGHHVTRIPEGELLRDPWKALKVRILEVVQDEYRSGKKLAHPWQNDT